MKVDLPVKKKTRIEMLPLIDVVFLLLVVFIYTMLSMAVHRGLPVHLPKSETANIEKQLILSVTIEKDGTIYLDKQKINLDDLTNTLVQKTRDRKNPGVLLFADNSIPYQELFRVLDRIKMAGLSRISLQAEAEK
jgi:biopolymer transport protein ExbD